jgi:hypothetical protein
MIICCGALLLPMLGCANQSDTGNALTAAGTVAVVVGAMISADALCEPYGENAGSPDQRCVESNADRTTGAAVAGAGLGLVATGYALKASDGPDRKRAATPRRKVSRPPPRLIRTEEEPQPSNE